MSEKLLVKFEKLLVKFTALVLALFILTMGIAYACTTQTFYRNDGSIVVCTVCCDPLGNCTTTCY